MPTDLSDFKLRTDNAYWITPYGKQVKCEGFSNVTFVENEEPQNTDEEPVMAAVFPKDNEFSMEMTMTNKQMRHLYKLFRRMKNSTKRSIRRYHRIVEKCRRSYLKGKSIEYTRKQYERSAYYIEYVKELTKTKHIQTYLFK